METKKWILATTFPIWARWEIPKLWLLVSWLIADVLSKKFSNVKSIITLNEIDSYQDRTKFVDPLISAYKKIWVDSDFRIDKENIKDLEKNILLLYNAWFIKESEEDVLMCSNECLKVEILKNHELLPEWDVYKKNKEWKYICKCCWEEVESHKRSILTMNFEKDLIIPKVHNANMEKDIQELFKRHIWMKMMISRQRETWISVNINRKTYNIDVDFLRMTFLKKLSNDYEKTILIGGNHIRRHLVTITLINQMLSKATNTKSVDIELFLHSYISQNNEINDLVNKTYLLEDSNILRLLILSSLSQNKDSKWNISLYKFFKKKQNIINPKSREVDHEAMKKLDTSQNIANLFNKNIIENSFREWSISDLRGFINDF